MSESATLTQHLDAEGVLTLTMNRPEVHNAFDDHQIQKMIDVLEAAQRDSSVRVLVLGSKGKSFSAGGDIDYMKRMGENSRVENLEDGARLAKLMELLNFFPKPTIARVQGAAMGGGFGLVSCCDYAIGTEVAKFATSEVKLGMVPATIAPYVVATIGEKNARRLFMSGQTISAEQALQMAVLSELVPESELDNAVDKLTKMLIKNGPNAVSESKQLAIKMAKYPVSESLKNETVKLIAKVRDSDEGREGLRAFLEKRKPNWILSN